MMAPRYNRRPLMKRLLLHSDCTRATNITLKGDTVIFPLNFILFNASKMASSTQNNIKFYILPPGNGYFFGIFQPEQPSKLKPAQLTEWENSHFQPENENRFLFNSRVNPRLIFSRKALGKVFFFCWGSSNFNYFFPPYLLDFSFC